MIDRVAVILSAMRNASAKEREKVARAYTIAERAHGNETRKSGEPYIIHPAAIAAHLAEIGMDTDTIVAGLLHDTLEDTSLGAEEIEKEFGKDVRFLVEGVTKLSKLKYRGLDRHFESLRRLLVATASDIRVIVIKLADRLHNMETIEHVALEKQKRIAKETLEVYAPIAGRLGISAFKRPLEDLAFKVLHPAEYAKTTELIYEKRGAAESALDGILKDIKTALAKNGVRTLQTEMRIKGAYSLWKKLDEKDGEMEKIYDLLAVRIIIEKQEECYQALGVIHSLWRPVPGRIRDYISYPKPNGYQALHTVLVTDRALTVEVQIVTRDMHHANQYGVASHFNYKLLGSKKPGASSTSWVRTMLPNLLATRVTEKPEPKWLSDLTNAVEESEHDAFQNALTSDFFAERMFAFTPKGDVVDLPVGATPVDFAYAIHTDLGDSMVGAKVGGKMVSLDTPLKNSDIVEIISKKNARPNKKWLEYAVTQGAQRKIRNALGIQLPKSRRGGKKVDDAD